MGFSCNSLQTAGVILGLLQSSPPYLAKSSQFSKYQNVTKGKANVAQTTRQYPATRENNEKGQSKTAPVWIKRGQVLE
jgi:hypothetical protein